MYIISDVVPFVTTECPSSMVPNFNSLFSRLKQKQNVIYVKSADWAW